MRRARTGDALETARHSPMLLANTSTTRRGDRRQVSNLTIEILSAAVRGYDSQRSVHYDASFVLVKFTQKGLLQCSNGASYGGGTPGRCEFPDKRVGRTAGGRALATEDGGADGRPAGGPLPPYHCAADDAVSANSARGSVADKLLTHMSRRGCEAASIPSAVDGNQPRSARFAPNSNSAGSLADCVSSGEANQPTQYRRSWLSRLLMKRVKNCGKKSRHSDEGRSSTLNLWSNGLEVALFADLPPSKDRPWPRRHPHSGYWTLHVLLHKIANV
uniref:Uncharacterized protein n=1 Tax=Plectus sambesii TaxID=2011161 RepID=A0A914VWY5_9BILA